MEMKITEIINLKILFQTKTYNYKKENSQNKEWQSQNQFRNWSEEILLSPLKIFLA